MLVWRGGKAERMGTLILARLAAPFGMWETHAPHPLPDTPDSMAAFHLDWQQCRGSQAFPTALGFTPQALQGPAGNLALVDLRRGVEQARYLWAGPNLVKLYGASLTGRLLSQCYRGQALADVRAAYQRMLDQQGPVFSDRRFRIFGEKLGYHRLLLPLLDERGKVGFAMLLLLPKGNLKSSVDWRPYEIELELAEALRSESR
ncbi:PAS domain-containing protein [Niveispirillum fermenti]|uniref:PAS domain-containing protein n=1 Tax=Niveispirillum fermenti TaxID=1233113 RepID=UPI003A87F3F3